MIEFLNSISRFIFGVIDIICHSWIGLFCLVLLIIGCLFMLVYRMSERGF